MLLVRKIEWVETGRVGYMSKILSKEKGPYQFVLYDFKNELVTIAEGRANHSTIFKDTS